MMFVWVSVEVMADGAIAGRGAPGFALAALSNATFIASAPVT
jgi:hypothetical protein